MLSNFRAAFGASWSRFADICGLTVAEVARVHWRMEPPPETLLPWLRALQSQLESNDA